MTGTTDAGWGLRAARAVPFAAVCVSVSALGHSLGGGGQVPLAGLLAGVVVVLAAAVLLAARERTLPGIAGGLAVGEFALHLWFHFLHEHMGSMAGAVGAQAMPGMPGMGQRASTPLQLIADKLLCGPLPPGWTAAGVVRLAGLDPARYAGAVPHATAAWFGMTPQMALGHLAAAVAAGWWLRRAEAACWRLLALVTVPLRFSLALLLALADTGSPSGALRPAPGRHDAMSWRLPGAALLMHQLVRRGPPPLLPA